MEYPFTKAEAAGNDFILIEAKDLPQNSDLGKLAIALCERKGSVGADGMLLLEESEVATVRMRIFNPDGGEVEMCGNGARCVALYKAKGPKVENIIIETKAGILEAEVNSGNKVKLKMSPPKDIKLDFNLEVDGSNYKVNYIDTGVPHVVLFVDDLEAIDVLKLGSNIRYHSQFQPAGTNVDFVKQVPYRVQVDNQNIEIRTYERGVEGETLACGTGAVAAAIISVYRRSHIVDRPKIRNTQYAIRNTNKINVHTKSKETLRVYFDIQDDKINNVWLEGSVEIVYRGRIDYV